MRLGVGATALTVCGKGHTRALPRLRDGKGHARKESSLEDNDSIPYKWTSHPVTVDRRDNRIFIRVLVYSRIFLPYHFYMVGVLVQYILISCSPIVIKGVLESLAFTYHGRGI